MIIGAITTVVQPQTSKAFVCREIVDAPIAASGENVYVTWPTNKTGNWEIMFRASNDSGQTFGDKINLSNSSNANSFHSDVAASENNVYVSFHDAKSGNVDTYIRTSTDGGQTFGPMIKVNGTGNLMQKSLVLEPNPIVDPIEDSEENTHIAATGDNVYVTSWDKKTGNWEVFLSASNDAGQTFGETINLSNTTDAKSDRAWLETEGNNVYVSWWETTTAGKQEPVIRVSNDNAETFGPALQLAANGTIGNPLANRN
jgi:nitrogen fixation protein FixH